METSHVTAINELSTNIHESNVKAGWWTDLKTGLKKDRNVGELLCLVHSEISEAMEGHRKNQMDDKLPHRSMFEVELADAMIRIFDIAGAHNLDLGGAMAEKIAYNKNREDHKIENRIKDGGKSY
jgi:NTP pyrophosphatase (non-canonical NTP hydrolase)